MSIEVLAKMEARCEAKAQSAIRVERKIFSANSINLSRSGSDLAQVEENAKAVVLV